MASKVTYPLDNSSNTSSSQAVTLAQAPYAKLAIMHAYWCVMGLCYKCANKWSKDHNCSIEVLIVVQELRELLPDEPK